MLTEPGPNGPRLSRRSGMTCYAHPMRPESTGHIHIVSADPRRPPAINFNFLSSPVDADLVVRAVRIARTVMTRSEEHTSELQSLMRISYAVFCLKKKKHRNHKIHT